MTGRFISADIIVQSPANPQTLNRYSYCLNNPLKYIDPTGYYVNKDWSDRTEPLPQAVTTVTIITDVKVTTMDIAYDGSVICNSCEIPGYDISGLEMGDLPEGMVPVPLQQGQPLNITIAAASCQAAAGTSVFNYYGYLYSPARSASMNIPVSAETITATATVTYTPTEGTLYAELSIVEHTGNFRFDPTISLNGETPQNMRIYSILDMSNQEYTYFHTDIPYVSSLSIDLGLEYRNPHGISWTSVTPRDITIGVE